MRDKVIKNKDIAKIKKATLKVNQLMGFTVNSLAF